MKHLRNWRERLRMSWPGTLPGRQVGRGDEEEEEEDGEWVNRGERGDFTHLHPPNNPTG